MSQAKPLNQNLFTHREAQRAGQQRARFAPSFIGGINLRECERILKESRNEYAVKYKEAHEKPLSKQDNLPIDTLNFYQEFAIHRDFRSRYCSPRSLRIRAANSTRQTHMLGCLFHDYAKAG